MGVGIIESGWHIVFQNCQVLQGPRYYKRETYLLIDNATSKDEGYYTCKFNHNEDGVSYSVTTTRSFAFKSKWQNSAQWDIRGGAALLAGVRRRPPPVAPGPHDLCRHHYGDSEIPKGDGAPHMKPPALSFSYLIFKDNVMDANLMFLTTVQLFEEQD